MIDEIRERFVNESVEILNQIQDELITGSRVGDVLEYKLVNLIYTTMHNIKGTAPMLGFTTLKNIVEPVEKTYKSLRSSDISFSEEIIEYTIMIVSLVISELLKRENNKYDASEVDKAICFFDSHISKNV